MQWSDFFRYEAHVAVLLWVFFLAYTLLLSRSTHHRFNRLFLLATTAAAFVLPLCRITFHETVIVPALDIDETLPVTALPQASAETPAYYPGVLWAAFLLGSGAFFFQRLAAFLRLFALVRHSKRRTTADGTLLLTHEKVTAPFSWWRYVFLPPSEMGNPSPAILLHEQAHLRARHSLDLLFLDLLTLLQWFNPALYLLRRELTILHEYEADDAVIANGMNVTTYLFQLIERAYVDNGYSGANSFNQTALKKRIIMAKQAKTSRKSLWKSLYCVPVALLSLAASATTVTNFISAPAPDAPARPQATERTSEPIARLAPKDSVILPVTKTTLVLPNDSGTHYYKNDREITAEEFEAQSKMTAHIEHVAVIKNRKPPRMIVTMKNKDVFTVVNPPALQKKSEPLVNSKEAVECYLDGKLITEEEMKRLQPSDIASMNVVKKDGKQRILITSKASGETSAVSAPPAEWDKNSSEMARYLAANTRYPRKAQKARLSGKVIVGFVLSKEGKVTQPKVLRSLSKECDAEALRVVRKMAAEKTFTPGKDGEGNPVATTLQLPITFMLR